MNWKKILCFLFFFEITKRWRRRENCKICTPLYMDVSTFTDTGIHSHCGLFSLDSFIDLNGWIQNIKQTLCFCLKSDFDINESLSAKLLRDRGLKMYFFCFNAKVFDWRGKLGWNFLIKFSSSRVVTTWNTFEGWICLYFLQLKTLFKSTFFGFH